MHGVEVKSVPGTEPDFMYIVLRETDMEFVPRKHTYLVSFLVKSKWNNSITRCILGTQ